MAIDNFVDNQGYDYAGVYVWYFIQKYGFEKFLSVYRGECEWQNLIYDGFEAEAIREFTIWIWFFVSEMVKKWIFLIKLPSREGKYIV